MTIGYCKKPCAECPWRMDNPPGRFPVERYVSLAGTAYDLAIPIFACHMSKEGGEVMCAGYYLQSGAHNLSVRLSGQRFDVESGGAKLYPTYRALARANGVPARHPALRHCRDDGQVRS